MTIAYKNTVTGETEHLDTASGDGSNGNPFVTRRAIATTSTTASHTITTCVSANTQYSISFTNAILIEIEAKEAHTWRWSLTAGIVAANAAASAIVSYPDGEGIFSLALPAFHPWTGTIYVASSTAGTNLNVLSWRLP